MVTTLFTKNYKICSGLVVYPAVIASRLESELPFMATENLIMAMVRSGADRQEVHERIRVHSIEAAKMVKERGLPNDMISRIEDDEFFAPIHDKTKGLLNAEQFIGRSKEQVDEFLIHELWPAIQDINSGIDNRLQV